MRIHLIDGTFELYRAHFSKRPRVVSSKVPGALGREMDVTATRGLLDSLVALFVDPDEMATHVAIAFDNPIVSFRNALFDGYKSDEGVPPELRAQFDLVEAACRALGVVVWSMNEFEADDALATGARMYAADPRVTQARICSPDKDMGQSLVGSRIVMVDRIRRRVVDETGFRAARGIGPESVPDYLALVGDTADGIPGLAGFGEKTTAQLLAEYIHLESLIAAADSWKTRVRSGARLAETLIANEKDVMLYRTLATLRYDVPIEDTIADLEYRGVRDEAFLRELGAEKTVERANARNAPENAPESAAKL